MFRHLENNTVYDNGLSDIGLYQKCEIRSDKGEFYTGRDDTSGYDPRSEIFAWYNVKYQTDGSGQITSVKKSASDVEDLASDRDILEDQGPKRRKKSWCTSSRFENNESAVAEKCEKTCVPPVGRHNVNYWNDGSGKTTSAKQSASEVKHSKYTEALEEFRSILRLAISIFEIGELSLKCDLIKVRPFGISLPANSERVFFYSSSCQYETTSIEAVDCIESSHLQKPIIKSKVSEPRKTLRRQRGTYEKEEELDNRRQIESFEDRSRQQRWKINSEKSIICPQKIYLQNKQHIGKEPLSHLQEPVKWNKHARLSSRKLLPLAKKKSSPNRIAVFHRPRQSLSTLIGLIFIIFSGVHGELLTVPHDTLAPTGSTVRLQCTSDLKKPVNWEWKPVHSKTTHFLYFGIAGLVHTAGERVAIDADPSTGKYDLVINGVLTKDAGTYICTEDSGIGTSKSSQLTVAEKWECNMDMPSYGFMGDNVFNITEDHIIATCSLTFSGNRDPTVIWSLSNAGSLVLTSATSSRASVITSTLKLRATKEMEKAVLKVQATTSNIPLRYEPSKGNMHVWSSEPLIVNYARFKEKSTTRCHEMQEAVFCNPACTFILSRSHCIITYRYREQDYNLSQTCGADETPVERPKDLTYVVGLLSAVLIFTLLGCLGVSVALLKRSSSERNKSSCTQAVMKRLFHYNEPAFV